MAQSLAASARFIRARNDVSALAVRYPEATLIVGVDGRYPGILRRYSGHTPYPDHTNAVAHTGAADAPFAVRRVVPFTVPSLKRRSLFYRGVFVQSGQSLELWYRKDGDAAGTLRKHALSLHGKAVRVSYYGFVDQEGQWARWLGAGFAGGEYPPYGSGDAFERDGDVNEFVSIPEGTLGVSSGVVAVGRFLRAGSQPVHNVAIWDAQTDAWAPLGAGFNGRVMWAGVVAVISDGRDSYRLFAAGAFTESDGVQCRGFAYWDGTQWVEAGGGVTLTGGTASVNGACADGTAVWIVGRFDTVDPDARFPLGAGPGRANGLAAFDFTAGHWSHRYITGGGGAATDTFTLNSSTTILKCVAYHSNAAHSKLFVSGRITSLPDGTSAANVRLFEFDSVGSTFTAVPLSPAAADKFYYVFPLVRNGDGSGTFVISGNFNGAHWGLGTAKNIVAVKTTLGAAPTFYALHAHNFSGDLASYPLVTSLTVAGNTILVAWDGAYLYAYNYTDYPGFTQPSGWSRHAALAGTIDGFGIAAHEGYVYLNGVSGNQSVAGGPENGATTDDFVWSVATNGPFMYLVSNKEGAWTLYFDGEDTPRLEPFGSPMMWLPQPTATAVATDGLLTIGSYVGALRLWDPVRGRASRISAQSNSVAFTDFMGYFTLTSPNFPVFPDDSLSWSDRWKAVAYSTISTLDPNRPGGGEFHRVYAGQHKLYGDENPVFSMAVGFEQSVETGGNSSLAVSDAGIASLPTYDFFRDDVRIPAVFFANAVYEDVHFVAVNEDGRVALRWSSPAVNVPEAFPLFNSYLTRIQAAHARTCCFVEIGASLFFMGGSTIYRIIKQGTIVTPTMVATGVKLLDAGSVTVVGARAFLATRVGLLELREDGTYSLVEGLSNIFLERWRDYLAPESGQKLVTLAYDEEMDCLYVHHQTLRETLCLWMLTGQVTLLHSNVNEVVVALDELDSYQSKRAYFISNRKTLSSPIVSAQTLSEPATMGLRFRPDGGPYNRLVTGCTYDPGTNTTTVTFDETVSPAIAAEYANSYGKAEYETGPFAIFAVARPSTGSASPGVYGDEDTTFALGKRWIVASGYSTSTPVLKLVGDYASAGPNQIVPQSDGPSLWRTGHVMSMSPVVFGVLGGMVAGSDPATSLVRVRITGYKAVPVFNQASGASSGAANTQRQVATAVTTARLPRMLVGAARGGDIAVWDDVSEDDVRECPFPFRDGIGYNAGVELSTDRPHANTIYGPTVDGPGLFPWWLFLLSNVHMDVIEVCVDAAIDGSTVSGAGVT